MGTIAYELTAEHQGTVTVYDTVADKEAGRGREVPKFAGTVALVDGSTFDVAEKLEEGDGRIEVEDTQSLLVQVLDEYPALKRMHGTGEPTLTGYGFRTAADLRRELARRKLSTSGVKPTLIERLEANDRFVADGDEEGAAHPKPEELLEQRNADANDDAAAGGEG